MTEENPGYWKVEKWSLSDLSKLTVRLNEFNASKTDLMDWRAKIILRVKFYLLRFCRGLHL